MTDRNWTQMPGTVLICVDGYDRGDLWGRIYRAEQQGENFESLARLLQRVDRILDETGTPQSFATLRTFAPASPLPDTPLEGENTPLGRAATFALQVRFRQHASWQGELTWLEKDNSQSFRSVLEVISLLESAMVESAPRY
ncbi:MAG: hypothetical protein SOW84_03245 [Candidatus Faecousia sp.]|nr:hypothetical protein [Candidatus Faecousia sp.]